MTKYFSNTRLVLLLLVFGLLAVFGKADLCDNKCPQKTNEATCEMVPCPTDSSPDKMCRRCELMDDQACLDACRSGGLKKALETESDRAANVLRSAQRDLTRAMGRLVPPPSNTRLKLLRTTFETQYRVLPDFKLDEIQEDLKTKAIALIKNAFFARNSARVATMASALGEAAGDVMVIKAQINEVIEASEMNTSQFMSWVRDRSSTVVETMQTHADNASRVLTSPALLGFLDVEGIVQPAKKVFDTVIEYIREGVSQFKSEAKEETVGKFRSKWGREVQTELKPRFAKAADDMFQGVLGKAYLGF